MKRDIEKTKQSIIEAAEELLADCGDISELTARAITQRAGVNLAMINYCFGSREKLLSELFSRMLKKAQAAEPRFAQVMASELPPRDKLIELHIFMMRLMLSNFELSGAVTRYILLERDLRSGMESLPFVMAHYRGKRSEEECRLITFQLTSINELAVLKHEEIKLNGGVDLTDGEQLRSFVTENISRFLV